jgi:hypothetical protein
MQLRALCCEEKAETGMAALGTIAPGGTLVGLIFDSEWW